MTEREGGTGDAGLSLASVVQSLTDSLGIPLKLPERLGHVLWVSTQFS